MTGRRVMGRRGFFGALMLTVLGALLPARAAPGSTATPPLLPVVERLPGRCSGALEGFGATNTLFCWVDLTGSSFGAASGKLLFHDLVPARLHVTPLIGPRAIEIVTQANTSVAVIVHDELPERWRDSDHPGEEWFLEGG